MDWDRVIDNAQKIGTMLAILGGGAWAYYNYFRGRTYRSRLEPKVEGKVFVRDGVHYLIATMELKNAGLSKIEIPQQGTALRVFAGRHDAQGGESLEWVRLQTLSIFETHAWIEPGETIRDQVLVGSATEGQVAFKMELRIVSSGLEWNTVGICGIAPQDKTASEEASHGFISG